MFSPCFTNADSHRALSNRDGFNIHVTSSTNMLFGISGSLASLEREVSNRPDILSVCRKRHRELAYHSLILIPIFVAVYSHNKHLPLSSALCTRARAAVYCIYTQSFYFYIPHERRRPGGCLLSVERHWSCTRMD